MGKKPTEPKVRSKVLKDHQNNSSDSSLDNVTVDRDIENDDIENFLVRADTSKVIEDPKIKLALKRVSLTQRRKIINK